MLEEETGPQRVSSWRILSGLGAEKFFAMANLYTRDTTQTEKLVPYFRSSSIKLFLESTLGGTSVLVVKHFQWQNSTLYKRITSIFRITLSHSRIQEKIEEVSFQNYQL